MALGDIDRRAVGLAALLAGAITFVHVSTSTGTITAATTNTLVMAVGIAAVPAGVVVGVLSGSYDRHLIEGGFAAAGGTAMGILGGQWSGRSCWTPSRSRIDSTSSSSSWPSRGRCSQ